MAVKHARVTVTTSATQLDTQALTDTFDGETLVVQNLGAASVFIGASTVTTSSYGYELKANSTLSIDLQPFESLWGIVASGTVTVNVLTQGA